MICSVKNCKVSSSTRLLTSETSLTRKSRLSNLMLILSTIVCCYPMNSRISTSTFMRNLHLIGSVMRRLSLLLACLNKRRKEMFHHSSQIQYKVFKIIISQCMLQLRVEARLKNQGLNPIQLVMTT